MIQPMFLSSILLLVGVSVGFQCSNYIGSDLATTEFCQNIACSSYCATHPIPEFCMNENYVSKNYCKQVGGFPEPKCTVTAGILTHHTPFCQNEACDFAVRQCEKTGNLKCDGLIVDWMRRYFSATCKDTGIIPVTTTTTRNPLATTTKPTITTTKAPVATTKPIIPATTTKPSTGGGCWAPSSWLPSADCKVCTQPQGDQCVSFGWTQCYATEAECKKNAGGSGGSCDGDCPQNTLSLTRPTFLGASCYNSEYGSQFGPKWVPSGKTRFEQLIKSPTQLFKMIQIGNDGLPWLMKTWNLKGCDAAAAVFENVVCAIEILESLNRQFEAPANAPGNYIKEFANSGNEQTDLLELAAFFSHKFKETARLQVWEENAGTAYADTTNTEFPAVAGQEYRGRGPVQISWNYNYGPFSQWFYQDKMILLNKPDKVDPEGPMGFIAAFWFWMTPRDFTSGSPLSGKIRTRDAIVHWTDGKMNSIYNDGKDYDRYAGLALSTNVINGGIECSGDGTSATWRVVYFLTVASRIGVDLPDMNNAATCSSNKLCNGLFAGCSSIHKGATCSPVDEPCGPSYVNGWQGFRCELRK